MSSPVGHSLAVLALFGRAPTAKTPVPGSRIWPAFVLVAAGNAPDFDFLPGLLIGDPNRFHHNATHSLGAAVLFAAAVVAVLGRRGRTTAIRWGVVLGAAYVTHLLLDLLTVDRWFPTGTPLFWPVSSQGVVIPIKLFLDIHHGESSWSFLPGVFDAHNMMAVAWEVTVMGAFFGTRAFVAHLRR